MRKLLTAAAALVAAVVVYALVVLPDAPARVESSGPPNALHVAGAFHVHTTRSDGASDKTEVARAAARAGLKFVVFSDHGDGTRAPDPPAYVEGVLCVDAVEVSTNQGHIVAVGIPQAPYPLGGDADAVMDDIHRLGGFGIAAHPGSAREALSWKDWSVAIDGAEWLNADSEWRDETRLQLFNAFAAYLLRPGPSLARLLDRPATTLTRIDEVASGRHLVMLAGHDAHGGIGAEEGERGRRWHIPSYEASFRTFSLRVALDRAFTGDAGRDGDMLISAIRGGRVYTVIDAVAEGAALDFRLGEGSRVTATAAAPAGSEILLLRDGHVVQRAAGPTLIANAQEDGAYRVEVVAPNVPGDPPVPLIVSSPISIGRPGVAADDRVASGNALPLSGAWRIEKDEGSSAGLVSAGGEVSVEYRLRAGPRVSQYVALVQDIRPAPFDVIALTARADGPMRISVQLRSNEQRWGRSVYLDSAPRAIRIPVGSLRPLDGQGPLSDPSRATSLLLVVDLTNASPGFAGRFFVQLSR